MPAPHFSLGLGVPRSEFPNRDCDENVPSNLMHKTGVKPANMRSSTSWFFFQGRRRMRCAIEAEQQAEE
ncbi:hypothetical protein EJB05_21741 [Eragrostis curvula]|uniref:Uncharacterized protein n=1 Tax=Eragrostis curvula TaxID=38414 RepID=A0A5J9V3M5_9POAL|nr:hypothetical protein EJB05_21741 [Eragrostis curvula]